MIRHPLLRLTIPSLALVALACGDSVTGPRITGFLAGTSTNAEIALVLNSVGKSLTLFQVGDPSQKRQIPLGTSSLVTPVSFSVGGTNALIPLGDAAAIALVNLDADVITRTFLFKKGNATGSVFVNDTTGIVANYLGNYVGRVTLHQASDSVRDTVSVTATPVALAVSGSRILVVSANLNTAVDYAPLGNSVVTALDATSLAKLGTVQTGGTNAQDAALGPDGKLYVVNTGDYFNPATLGIINPATLALETTIADVGVGAGAIKIDKNGIAYISSFFSGTVVFDTKTKTFLRSPANPVCANTPTKGCRGAFDATVASTTGNLYQVFIGSSSQSLAPYVFVFTGGTYALKDSVAAGVGPTFIQLRTF